MFVYVHFEFTFNRFTILENNNTMCKCANVHFSFAQTIFKELKNKKTLTFIMYSIAELNFRAFNQDFGIMSYTFFCRNLHYIASKTRDADLCPRHIVIKHVLPYDLTKSIPDNLILSEKCATLALLMVLACFVYIFMFISQFACTDIVGQLI